MRIPLYTDSGERFETCPDATHAEYDGSGSAQGKRSIDDVAVYPNPVAPGGVIKLRQGTFADDNNDDDDGGGGEEEPYAALYLFDVQGRLVLTGSTSALRAGLAMPETPGVYHLILKGKAGRKVVKVAVGQSK
jgi:hypothetical protein